MVWAVGCLRNFSSTLQWSCFPSLSIPIPSYTGPCQWLNLTQHCCGKCSITKLLNRKPLMLRISCNWIVLRHDLGFVLHKCPVLIQVLSTCLLCVNLFKSHSGTEHFDCDQINLRDCLVFVQCLGRWVSALGISSGSLQKDCSSPAFSLCPHTAGCKVTFPLCWSRERTYS